MGYFRPVAIDPAWLTPKVTSLAQAIYNDRAFDRMPELADALQEVGCDHQDMLSHCRGPGPHVKGWGCCHDGSGMVKRYRPKADAGPCQGTNH